MAVANLSGLPVAGAAPACYFYLALLKTPIWGLSMEFRIQLHTICKFEIKRFRGLTTFSVHVQLS